MRAAYKKILIALLIALAAAALAYQFHTRQSIPARAQKTVAKAERKVLYWYDPMAPEQHFDKPGKSPFMDMELIPKYAEENTSAGVRIDAATQQNLAVRTALVERAPLAASTSAVGTIVFDERDLIVLQARANGFVQRVYVHAVGDRVRRNDALVDLLIPEWSGVQQELIALKDSGDTQLLDAVRARALALGMSPDQITSIVKTGKSSSLFTVRTPQAGVIKTLDAREGMNIGAATTLLAINGIERVWLELSIPEYAASTLRVNDKISVKPNTGAAKILNGNIVALLPELNDATRTVRVRVELENKSGELHIGQYAQANIVAGDTTPALTVPTEALIRGGESDRVIVMQDDGSFAPRQVSIGREAGGRTEILGGLKDGQRVVSSGQFLIDSEASLSGQATRMQRPAAALAPTADEQDHGAHQHD